MTSPEAKSINSVCPRCGAGLRCAMVAGDAECWCAHLPRVMPVPAALPLPVQPDTTVASCFCPACLQQISDERHNTFLPAPD